MSSRHVSSYSRVSTDEQAQMGFSLGDQQDRMEKFCQRHGHVLELEITDDFSAKTFNRPGFNRMLDFIKSNPGKIDLLLVLKWSRFARNLADALIMIRDLQKLGVEVNAVEEWIDYNSPNHLIQLAMALAMPEIDNVQRSISVKDGMRRANAMGRYLGAAPRGYKNERDSFKKPIIVPTEQSVFIAEAFAMMSEGIYSQPQVRSYLKSKGFEVTKTQLPVMLRNRTYTGKVLVRANKEEAEHWVDGLHTALVSEELFEKVQAVLEKRSNRKQVVKTSRLNEELPLRGLLRCSCGRSLTGSKSTGNGGAYHYYHCNACKVRYSASSLNKQMEELLSGIQIDSNVKELYWEIIKDCMKGSDEDRKREIKKRDNEIQKQQSRIDNLTDLVADGQLAVNDFAKAKKKYEDTINNMILERTELSMIKTEFDEYVKWGLNLLENIQSFYLRAPVVTKQQIIGSIYPGKIEISEKKLRTTKTNELVVLISSTINQLGEKETGQTPEFQNLSRQVLQTGLSSNHFFNDLKRLWVIKPYLLGLPTRPYQIGLV